MRKIHSIVPAVVGTTELAEAVPGESVASVTEINILSQEGLLNTSATPQHFRLVQLTIRGGKTKRIEVSIYRIGFF